MKQAISSTVLQEQLLMIAKNFHAICERNHLKYYMVGGTLLGSIRHSGFIPWDDDMDFGMPREDYDRFINLPKHEIGESFELLNYKSRDECPIHYTKMVNSCTTLIEDDYHNFVEGLYIDIFPLDITNPNRLERKIEMGRVRILHWLIMNHCSTKDKNNAIKRFLKGIAKKLDIEKLHAKLERIMLRSRDTDSDLITNYLGAYGNKEMVSKKTLGVPTLYQFEDTMFYGPEKYSVYLKSIYNDYMTLPPEEDRVLKHNYYFLDLSMPFRKYSQIQE